jgi:hypothetical protein
VTSHTLRTVLFFFPVQVLVSALLFWGGIRTVRARTFGIQVFLTALSVAWAWAQLRHEYVI